MAAADGGARAPRPPQGGAGGTGGPSRGGAANGAGDGGAPPNCPRCAHFFVTWQAAFPRGCRLYGFKTSGFPSARVLEVTGKPCQGFQAKGGARGEGGKRGRAG